MYVKKDLTEILGYEPENKDEYIFIEDHISFDDIKEIKDGQVVLYTAEEKAQKELEAKKQELLREVRIVADEKTREVEPLLAEDFEITTSQIDRYYAKYQLAQKAKAGDESAKKLFILEAGSEDKVGALIDTIIELGTKWDTKKQATYCLIDQFRVRVKNLINAGTDAEKIEEILEKAKAINPIKGTIEDLEAILKV